MPLLLTGIAIVLAVRAIALLPCAPPCRLYPPPTHRVCLGCWWQLKGGWGLRAGAWSALHGWWCSTCTRVSGENWMEACEHGVLSSRHVAKPYVFAVNGGLEGENGGKVV